MNCGIKKYDKLPARVNTIDVDYLRFCLFLQRKKGKNIIEKVQCLTLPNEITTIGLLELDNVQNGED